jgi:hypothetical protein
MNILAFSFTKNANSFSLFSDFSKYLAVSTQMIVKLIQNNPGFADRIKEKEDGFFSPPHQSVQNVLLLPAGHITTIKNSLNALIKLCTSKGNLEKLIELFGIIRGKSDFVIMQERRINERNEVFEWESKFNLPFLEGTQSRNFVLHSEGVKITNLSNSNSSSNINANFFKGKSKFNSNLTVFSDCLILANGNTVIGNLPIKGITIRNPKIQSQNDTRFHVIVTQNGVFDLEFLEKEGCVAFEVCLNKTIDDQERGGIFGRDLRELFLEFNDLPPQIRKLGELLQNEHNIIAEGLFRLAGGSANVSSLKALLATETWYNTDIEKFHSTDSIATVFKQFFLSLPEPLFPYAFYDSIVAIAADKELNQHEKQAKLKDILNSAPLANRSMIAFLLNLLANVAVHQDKNKMTPRNLAIVFSPSLFAPKFENKEKSLENASHLSRLLEGMIEKLARVKAVRMNITFTTTNANANNHSLKQSEMANLQERKGTIKLVRSNSATDTTFKQYTPPRSALSKTPSPTALAFKGDGNKPNVLLPPSRAELMVTIPPPNGKGTNNILHQKTHLSNAGGNAERIQPPCSPSVFLPPPKH